MKKSTKSFYRRSCLLMTLCLALGVALAGCTSSADMTAPSVSPGASASPMATTQSPTDGPSPDTSAEPDMPAGSASVSLEDSKKASEQMEDAVVMLTEIDDAYVVALGNRALVGIKADGQYQGTVDERLQKAILTRLQTIDKAVTEIYVTDDEARRGDIEKLAEELEKATDIAQIQTRFDELVQGMTAYRE